MADSRAFASTAQIMGQLVRSPITTLKDKAVGCDRDRYSDLLGRVIFDCAYDSDYLNVPNNDKFLKRRAKCDKLQEEYDKLEKVCYRPGSY